MFCQSVRHSLNWAAISKTKAVPVRALEVPLGLNWIPLPSKFHRGGGGDKTISSAVLLLQKPRIQA
jgi:hypothetical protein